MPSPHRLVYVGPKRLIGGFEMLGYDIFTSAASGRLGEHSHPEGFEICYIRSGSVDWWVEEQIYEVTAGDVYITRPGERHGGVGDVMNPCELYWLLVAPSALAKKSLLLREHAQALGADLSKISLRHFRGSAKVAHAFERLIAAHRDRPSHAAALASAAFIDLLVHVVNDHATALHHRENESKLSSTMRHARAWIDENLASDFSIADAADAVGMKPSRFHEAFLQQVGLTPADYRTRRRIRQAKLLLRQQNRTITEIAHELGFSTSQYFATVFKNHVGISPRDYARDTSRTPEQLARLR